MMIHRYILFVIGICLSLSLQSMQPAANTAYLESYERTLINIENFPSQPIMWIFAAEWPREFRNKGTQAYRAGQLVDDQTIKKNWDRAIAADAQRYVRELMRKDRAIFWAALCDKKHKKSPCDCAIDSWYIVPKKP